MSLRRLCPGGIPLPRRPRDPVTMLTVPTCCRTMRQQSSTTTDPQAALPDSSTVSGVRGRGSRFRAGLGCSRLPSRLIAAVHLPPCGTVRALADGTATRLPTSAETAPKSSAGHTPPTGEWGRGRGERGVPVTNLNPRHWQRAVPMSSLTHRWLLDRPQRIGWQSARDAGDS